jgi:hypothetical protein
MENLLNQEQILDTWAAIGLANGWINEACDPAFSKLMLKKCENLEQLEYFFRQGNWCLGQGFYYRNLCFINQLNGGDEWLTIKDDYDFESVTFGCMIERGEFYRNTWRRGIRHRRYRPRRQ